MNTMTSTGCGAAACTCAESSQVAAPRINGIALHPPGAAPDADTLRELACVELLRQRAVHLGLLPCVSGHLAPPLAEADRGVIEAMVDGEVASPEPTDDECRRHYEANKARFAVGQALHLRHILFAVTPGVDVHALTRRAESALLDLTRKDAPSGRFEQLAAELSNCPSSAQGGDLGWVTPEDCAPELAQTLFFQAESPCGVGVHPRLVHTRFGLHIVEVLDRRQGTLPPYEELAPAIQQHLEHRSRAAALRQYMRLLAGQARVEGIELDGADSPLVQ